MFTEHKLDRICGAFIRGVLFACVSLVGFLLFALSFVALGGMGEPGPRPSLLVSVPVSLLFFAAGVGWFFALTRFARYLRNRRHQHRA